MKYDKRGVSASKNEVHTAIKGGNKGLFPNAFCTVLPDYAANDAAYCTLMHADTAGTKTALAYLYWRETNDISVWEGIVQDALIMNIDDLGCVGLTNNFLVSSTIGRNKRLITGDVLSALIVGTRSLAARMQAMGIDLHLAGGETADVGDIVRTLDVGFTVFGRLPRKDILVNNIQVGDVIVGLASYGQATYETTYNSGIGSNGLTGARHDVLHKRYATKYPECYDTMMPDEVAFTGSKKLTDTVIFNDITYTVAQLLLSPTRTYLPFLQQLFALQLPLNGIIHCTGGGQTKVEKFIPDTLHIIKDNLLPVPPVFQLIQSESNTDWREMYQVFNMGHRLEVYLPAADADTVIKLAQSLGIAAQVVGRVEHSTTGKQVTVKSEYGIFNY
jgi:phosphoribosylformylglycinamidine cyclo-ligase